VFGITKRKKPTVWEQQKSLGALILYLVLATALSLPGLLLSLVFGYHWWFFIPFFYSLPVTALQSLDSLQVCWGMKWKDMKDWAKGAESYHKDVVDSFGHGWD